MPRDVFCGQCGTPARAATPVAHQGTPRQRRSKRRWFQRPLLMVPLVLLLVIGSVGGYVLFQAGTTVSTIHQLSTPAPAVSIDVLLDASSAGSGVDTSAAEDTDGDAIVTTGGAAARTTSKVGPTGRGSVRDLGEPSAVDASGDSVDGGPTQIDTGPAIRSLESDPRYAGYGENKGGTLDGVQEVAGGLGGGVAAVTGAGAADAPREPINILLMGVDARPGESIDIAVRPDALAVLHLDPVNDSCRMLAIPRDTRVELPGYGQSKINHALAVGGVPYQMQVVERSLGIQLDHYGLIDFSGIVQLVDSVGGVTIEVPETFTHMDVTFPAGRQTLNGEDALVYARYRYGPDGDFGRIRRQQQILRALIAEMDGLDVTRAANELMPALKEHTRTDQTPADIVDLMSAYRGTCTEASTSMENLDGTTGTFPDPLLNLDLSYVIIDESEVRTKVAWLLGG